MNPPVAGLDAFRLQDFLIVAKQRYMQLLYMHNYAGLDACRHESASRWVGRLPA